MLVLLRLWKEAVAPPAGAWIETKAQASKAIQDGAAVNHDAAFANLTKSAAVLAEKNCLDRQVRDALISIGAHILVQAQKEAVAAQDAKAESAKKADKAA